MNAIRKTKELNDRELENCTSTSASWHRDYADTAFIYIGGLDLRLSEGDVITIFSQYGEPDFVNLVRDRETGKSKGFAFLRYQDQRSTDLAVDNLGGASVMGRLLNVEHTRYKKRDDEDLADNTRGFLNGGEDGPKSESEDSEPDRPLLEEERQLARLLRDIDDEDPMKAELVRAKQDEVARALRRLKKDERRKERREHRHKESRSHRKSKRDPDDEDRREKRSKRRRSRSREARDRGRVSR
jgi:RNA-binding motif protein, X-linked 2